MIPNENQLIRQHEGLCRMIVARYAYATSLPKEDLLAIGRSGLLQAIRRYDPRKGKFSIFAFVTIKGFVLNSVRDENQQWPIRFMTSMDEPIHHDTDGEPCSLHDRLSVRAAISVEQRQQLQRALWRLPLDDRHRMTALAHGTPQALDNLTVSRERNRQLRAVALGRLQRIFKRIEAVSL